MCVRNINGVFLLIAVLFGFSPTGSAKMKSDEGFKYFKEVFYPYWKDTKLCGACHITNQAPQFLTTDLQVAYKTTLNYVNFNDVNRSILIRQSMPNAQGVGHCKNLANCKTDGKMMTKMLTEWAKIDGDGGVARKRTEEVILPNLLADEYQTISFDLSKLSPGVDGLKNAFFSIEAKKFTEDSIIFRRPKLASKEAPIYFKDIVIELSTPTDPIQKFRNLERSVNPKSLDMNALNWQPIPTLSVDRMVALSVDLKQTIKVRIGFADIKVGVPAMKCKNLKGFEENVYNSYVDRRCFFCHSGGPEKFPKLDYEPYVNAWKSWDMDDSVEGLCDKSLERANFANPLRSPFIWFALGYDEKHPRGIPYVQEVDPFWTNWINSEK